MKKRMVKKGDRFVKKYSPDSGDWITVIIVVQIIIIALLQMILRG